MEQLAALIGAEYHFGLFSARHVWQSREVFICILRLRSEMVIFQYYQVRTWQRSSDGDSPVAAVAAIVEDLAGRDGQWRERLPEVIEDNPKFLLIPTRETEPSANDKQSADRPALFSKPLAGCSTQLWLSSPIFVFTSM